MPPTYRDVRRALLAAGWTPLRQRGSHEIWGGPDGRRRFTVAGKNSATVPRAFLASMRRETGLKDV
ncbi:MAG: type II toxin-antitoxin system HicA family toxin [Actinomycetota bacterium]